MPNRSSASALDRMNKLVTEGESPAAADGADDAATGEEEEDDEEYNPEEIAALQVGKHTSCLCCWVCCMCVQGAGVFKIAADFVSLGQHFPQRGWCKLVVGGGPASGAAHWDCRRTRHVLLARAAAHVTKQSRGCLQHAMMYT